MCFQSPALIKADTFLGGIALAEALAIFNLPKGDIECHVVSVEDKTLQSDSLASLILTH